MNKMKALMLAGGLVLATGAASISYAEPVDNSANSVTVVENPVETFQSSTSKETSKQNSGKGVVQKVFGDRSARSAGWTALKYTGYLMAIMGGSVWVAGGAEVMGKPIANAISGYIRSL